MRRGDQPDASGPVAHFAEPPESPFFENLQELGLDLEVDVADLVEEERPAVRALEEPGLGGDRAGERAFLVAEQLGLEQLAVEPRAVQVDEDLVAAGTAPVQPGCEHALPRPGFALDQDRTIAFENARRPLVELANGAAFADEGIDRLPLTRGLVLTLPAPVEPVLERPLQDEKKRQPVDRADQELVRAVLQSLGRDAEVDRLGEDDERDVRPLVPDPGQQVERIAVRQTSFRDHGRRPRRAEAVESRAAGLDR